MTHKKIKIHAGSKIKLGNSHLNIPEGTEGIEHAFDNGSIGNYTINILGSTMKCPPQDLLNFCYWIVE
jgi:hypothetical protein